MTHHAAPDSCVTTEDENGAYARAAANRELDEGSLVLREMNFHCLGFRLVSPVAENGGIVTAMEPGWVRAP